MTTPKDQITNLSDDALAIVKKLCLHFFNMGYAKACVQHKKKVPQNPSECLPLFTVEQFKHAINEL